MRSFILVILLFCCFLSASSQTFSGKVTTETGEIIPYATIYIRELTSGFITDENGYFQTSLPAGNYTCEVSSLGYNRKLISIHVSDNGLEKEISLSERIYQLKEVDVTVNHEDPAYAVMKQTIGRAPYYRTLVTRYTADTYLKGTGKLQNIPGVLKLSKEVRKGTKEVVGKLFLLEEQRRVTFTSPNNWNNEVKAYRNSFPEEININLETTNINLYQPTIFGKVSPLSSGAFTYYQFKLDGCYAQGEHLINKIRVIPKKNSPDLISGHIYIVENIWCLSEMDVLVDSGGFSVKVKVMCNEVQPSVFLNTSINLSASVDVMGFKGEASYLSTIKYDQIELREKTLLPEKVEELLSKEKLNTREAYKLSKLMSQSIEQADTTKKDKYERSSRQFSLREDSLATKRDSVYWALARTVPLKPEEQESYEHKEQLQLRAISAEQGKASHRNTTPEVIMQTLTEGKTFWTKNKKKWLTFNGLSSCIPEYNFVDGVWLGITFKSGMFLNKQTSLNFTPEVYYTTEREKVIFNNEFSLQYLPRRLGNLRLRGGITSADFNGETGQSRLVNSFSSLWFGRNDIKFYDKRYVSVDNEIELINSLLLSTGILWERRNTLDNFTHTGWFGVKGKPNLPRNPYYERMPQNDLLKASVSLTYTPARYYRMHEGKKHYEDSNYPTFTFHYEKTFSHGGVQKLSPSYHRTELSVEQTIDFGIFNSISWYVNGGAFWDTKNMYFPDFKHFTATRIPLTIHSFDKGFALLDNYTHSTHTRWAQANIVWYAPYLLVKHIPFLQRKRFDEAIHLRSLAVFDRHPYSELGYSIGWLDAIRIGIFTGFNRLKFQSVGVSVSIPLKQILGY
ncbi:DUF5686 and carboxypeptidase regulatory-like domain-containing protein [Bacteroides sp. 224]|uniref:DUF5686 and carboxypeptidase regulatory-like domain-containing protein n=1 Tax=Bacteroides sp. 224 TaxID=2302936 RepID=UPI0013D1864F|nr:DUF5686 and carboxypeptidase regulatory-like domain-containing protein [Bacteroides sp. 224]NDV66779.1 carboxypeptidase-like regulatory domain-containing protein [Bacteroides sp. 224]